ncbi:MAG: VOC family protein [Planctomycetes bacterium]|nr:VOC family protein [Planctomycetota bacterium]
MGILATAPRPGLVLQGLCPPLTEAEAAALGTAWMKALVTELPGVAVHLLGRPADAMPMLRYFAGPGVSPSDWNEPGTARPNRSTMVRALHTLLDRGHAPVAVRTVDAPDTTEAGVLGCLDAARLGSVEALDQRGEPWLLAAPDREAVQDLAAGRAARRGPWARTVQVVDDLVLLAHERDPAHGTPMLPVRDLQAALRFYESLFASELLARTDNFAFLGIGGARLALHERRLDFVKNGVRLPCSDLSTRIVCAREAGALDETACETAGTGVGKEATATDQDGNRITFFAHESAR